MSATEKNLLKKKSVTGTEKKSLHDEKSTILEYHCYSGSILPIWLILVMRSLLEFVSLW